MAAHDPTARRRYASRAAQARWNPETRRDLAAERLAEHIRRVVDAAPPLTPEQVERLSTLLLTPTLQPAVSAA
jgi:hypothetical protein